MNHGSFCRRSTPPLGDAELQIPQGDGRPGQQGYGGIGHALLQPLQADPHNAQAPLPLGIDTAAFAGQAHGIALQTADQHSDGDDQQQPIDALRVAQAAALQLEEAGFLIAEQLLAAEALAVAPDQIDSGISVADQIPGLYHRQAGGKRQQQVRPMTALSPQRHIAETAAVFAWQSQPAHLTAHRCGGAIRCH